jgi:AcrR family transcriptional regulator
MSRRSDVAEDRSSVDAVRERILGAAFAAFMDRGYAGTTTREIASRARVSKRELYTLFENKQAMLAACIRNRSQRALQPLELGPVRDRRVFESRLKAYGRSFLLEISRPTVVALYRLAILEAESSPEVGRALSTYGKEAITHALSDFVREAQAAGFLGKGDPSTIARRFMSLLWGNTMLGLLLRAEDAPDEKAAERRARDAVAALLRLFPPPK